MVKKSARIGEGLGIAGFTLGVLSILLAGLVGVFIAVVGFIFCMVQQKKNPTKLAKVGVVLNVIGFVLSLIIIFYLLPALQQQLQNLPI